MPITKVPMVTGFMVPEQQNIKTKTLGWHMLSNLYTSCCTRYSQNFIVQARKPQSFLPRFFSYQDVDEYPSHGAYLYSDFKRAGRHASCRLTLRRGGH